MVMNNFKTDYAVLDISHERYNITQTNVIDAIICMSKHGALKINDDLFDAFSYNLSKHLVSLKIYEFGVRANSSSINKYSFGFELQHI